MVVHRHGVSPVFSPHVVEMRKGDVVAPAGGGDDGSRDDATRRKPWQRLTPGLVISNFGPLKADPQ